MTIYEEIQSELDSANAKFPPFHSAHEGYAVIKEELDELWDEIRLSKVCRGNRLMRKEAVQVAAMAVKFIQNLCEGK